MNPRDKVHLYRRLLRRAQTDLQRIRTANPDKPLNWWSRQELQAYLEDRGFAVYDDEPEEDLLEAVRLDMEEQEAGRYADVKTADFRDLDEFTRSYLEAALWASSCGEEDDCENLDDKYGFEDISQECLQTAQQDCDRFRDLAADLMDQLDYNESRWSNDELAGHDFFLTRNGHGVGFWDRDLGDLGDQLTAVADQFGEIDFYVGDDGLIYCQ